MFERLAKYWRRPAVDSKAETGILVHSLSAQSLRPLRLCGDNN